MPIDPDKLKSLRLSRNLTQRDVARRAGFPTYQSYQRMERGRSLEPRPGTLAALAEVFKVHMEDLLK